MQRRENVVQMDSNVDTDLLPVRLGVVAVAELLQNESTRSAGSDLLRLGDGTVHACQQVTNAAKSCHNITILR